MINVLTAIEIDCPIQIVSNFSSNPENVLQWYKKINSVEWVSGSGLKEGSKVAFKAQFLNKELNYIYEIVSYEPNKELIMKTSDGPFLMETTYMWYEAGESKTLMLIRNRGYPEGFSKLVSPFMPLLVKRANKQDLKKLKEILEQANI